MMDLAAEDRSGREILIDGGTEMDAVLIEQRADPRERHVIAAKGRAFVAGDEDTGTQIGCAVEADLIHRQADERLNAGQVDGAVFAGVAVGEFHRSSRYLYAN